MLKSTARLVCFGIAAGLLACTGCASIPERRQALTSLEFRGNDALGDDDIRDQIASQESPRFLGLFPGVVYDYEVFDRFVLERDLQRIVRYYRAKGFYQARVRAGRVLPKGPKFVRVEIVVEEGPVTTVKRLDVHGLDTLPSALAGQVLKRVQDHVGLGRRFEEEQFDAAQMALTSTLADSGYAFVNVRRSAAVDLSTNGASVGFWVEPGPLTRIGDVRIEGLGAIPEGPVRRALALEPGQPYSASDLESAERALLELGVFGAVSVRPEIDEKQPPGEHPVVPIVVRVEPTELRVIGLGGGVEVDALRSEVHLRARWESRNFLGGLRGFMAEIVPGAVLYPTHLPTFTAPQSLLPELTFRTGFRQPGFLESRTHALLNAQGSVYPVLLSPDPIEGAPLLGYLELRTSAGVERGYWRLSTNVSHNVQVNSPFTYEGQRDPDLHTIVASYPSISTQLDLRDSQVEPHAGAYFSASGQYAGIGGHARDVKIQPEARGYVPIGRHATFALRATLGLLFPQNYGSSIEPDAMTKTPGTETRATWVRDLQIMFLRGFFSGGPGSNRGYLLREIGPHGIVPFFNPGQTNLQIAAQCDPSSPVYDLAVCNLPLGGFTLWEASAELRFSILGPLKGALFLDTSDVAPQILRLRWRPHMSTGLGLRYSTPVGPIRLDMGYRIPGLQAPDSPDEGVPKTLFGAPMAVSFGIGEAF